MQEAKEREWRAKERAAAERQAAMMADLAAAREHQMRAKLVSQSQMAAVEQEEFKRVLQVNQEKAAQEYNQVESRLMLHMLDPAMVSRRHHVWAGMST